MAGATEPETLKEIQFAFVDAKEYELFQRMRLRGLRDLRLLLFALAGLPLILSYQEFLGPIWALSIAWILAISAWVGAKWAGRKLDAYKRWPGAFAGVEHHPRFGPGWGISFRESLRGVGAVVNLGGYAILAILLGGMALMAMREASYSVPVALAATGGWLLSLLLAGVAWRTADTTLQVVSSITGVVALAIYLVNIARPLPTESTAAAMLVAFLLPHLSLAAFRLLAPRRWMTS